MARDETYTPFTGRTLNVIVPMRTLHRFTKPGHVAEIRERVVTAFAAIEWMVFIDGQFTESQMFHGARISRYGADLDARRAQFTEAGWVEVPPESRGESRG